MKNTINVLSVRVLGIIAIVAVIGLTMIACNKSGGGEKSFNSAEDIKKYLDKQPVNKPHEPIKVSMDANEPMLPQIAKAIKDSSKYVSLNLTGNALTTIPDSAFYRSETLVGITIPDSVISIGNRAFYDTGFTSVTFEGKIASRNFINSFPGDLHEKYLASNGGPGIYISNDRRTWKKQ